MNFSELVLWPEERLLTSSRPLLFMTTCPLKGTGFERKYQVNFFKAFWWSFFKMSYFKKIFLHAMAVLGYLAKLKRGLGLAFRAHFCMIFP